MNSDRVEALLQDLARVDADRHDLVVRLRKLVREVDSRITEDVKYGGILFTAGSPFCGVFSYARHVSLEFSRGAALADPHRVLEGEGKHRRHIKLVVRGDLYKKNVREYVEAAWRATQGLRGKAAAARG